MKPSNPQPDQDHGNEQQQQKAGRFQNHEGVPSPTDDKEKVDDAQNGKRSHPYRESDVDVIDHGDDVRGRSGKSVVHPDDENGNDPDDETANANPR